ncbi:CDP-glycerol glycerophosphotransferase family protein [Microlunatus panaciterrae]|uniref:CDP-glycerol glycerophosphotransferase family protein n=1 Tax=Microlunatus panaciterrae TaxID=400768 RepID=UPI00195E5D10
MIRRALRALGPQLPLALGLGLLVALVAAPRQPGLLVWFVSVVVGLAVLAVPALELVGRATALRAYGLAGYAAPAPPPPARWIRFGVGVLIIAVALAAAFAVPAVLLGVGVLGAIALVLTAGLGFLRIRSRGADRARIRSALEAWGPRFLLYTGRRNDASYQLAMWVPLLERLRVPYLVVVRHVEAVAATRKVTDAPIVCCPENADLDCVAVGSAVFYVNMVAQNTPFVLYRNLTHVYLGHGDSDKELSAHPGHAMFDRIFVAGRAAVDRYPANGVVIPPQKIVEVGRPQLAGIAKADRAINEVAVPRVLLAPTWRGYNANTNLSFLPAAEVLAAALIARGVEVIFRPHPFSWLGRAERATIAEVDTLLTSDRTSSGRRHVLATEGRGVPISDAFDDSDACITDIGSVLVDYFATLKPYAVVLPPGVEYGCAHERFPTTGAAYLMKIDDLVGPRSTQVLGRALDDLLGADPMAHRRVDIAHYYLGQHPGDDEPFLRAAREVIGLPS